MHYVKVMACERGWDHNVLHERITQNAHILADSTGAPALHRALFGRVNELHRHFCEEQGRAPAHGQRPQTSRGPQEG